MADLPRIYTLPRWAPMTGFSAFGAIGVRSDVPREAVLEHELVHIAQQRRDGAWRWHWRYVVSRAWRAQYEAEAYRVDIAAGRVTLQQAAAFLSGPLYLHPCTYAEAERLLTEGPWPVS